MALNRGRGLTGAALKWIALGTMFIDHVGATLLLSLYYRTLTAGTRYLYYGARVAGRLAFPIFCFLLVEGFAHTRDRRRYALRLGVFALVSEIPFDIAFKHPANGLLEFSSQNVFFTLLLGLLALCLWDALARRLPGGWGYAGLIPAVLVCALAAERLSTDYGGFGVLLIAALGAGRGLPGREPPRTGPALPLLLGAGAVLYYCQSHNNWIEIYAVFGLALCACYTGERGRSVSKWFFYAFYPVHLLALGLLNQALF